VFDVYDAQSLMSVPREKRGSGIKTRVSGTTKLPKTWQEFLSVDDNKTDLFHYRADTCVSIDDNIVVMTSDDHVKLCSGAIDVSSIEPLSHEEAETRLILHCRHAATNGTRRQAIRTVDMYVVV